MVGRILEVQAEGRCTRLVVTLDDGGLWSHRCARWAVELVRRTLGGQPLEGARVSVKDDCIVFAGTYVFPLEWMTD